MIVDNKVKRARFRSITHKDTRHSRPISRLAVYHSPPAARPVARYPDSPAPRPIKQYTYETPAPPVTFQWPSHPATATATLSFNDQLPTLTHDTADSSTAAPVSEPPHSVQLYNTPAATASSIAGSVETPFYANPAVVTPAMDFQSNTNFGDLPDMTANFSPLNSPGHLPASDHTEGALLDASNSVFNPVFWPQSHFGRHASAFNTFPFFIFD
jgi:hypothetical protein